MLRADSGLADANATALSLRQNLKDCKTALNGLDDEVQRLAVEWEQHEQDATYYEQQSQKNRARATELLAKAEHQGLAAQSCMQQAEDCRAELEERLNSTAYDLSTARVDSGRKWVRPRAAAAGRAAGARCGSPRSAAASCSSRRSGAAACRSPAPTAAPRRPAPRGVARRRRDLPAVDCAAQRRGRRRDAARRARLLLRDAAGDALLRELDVAAAPRQPPPPPTAHQRRAHPGAPPLPGRARRTRTTTATPRARRRAGSRNWGRRVGGGGVERERDRDGNVWSAATGRKSPSRFARTTSPFIDDEDDADGVSELIDVTVRNARNKPLGLNVRDGYVSHVAAGSPASHKLHVGDKIVSVDGKMFDRYTPFSPDLSAGEHHFRVQRSLKPPKDAGYGYFSS